MFLWTNNNGSTYRVRQSPDKRRNSRKTVSTRFATVCILRREIHISRFENVLFFLFPFIILFWFLCHRDNIITAYIKLTVFFPSWYSNFFQHQIHIRYGKNISILHYNHMTGILLSHESHIILFSFADNSHVQFTSIFMSHNL